jgi:O-acetyl-ADP-ribose deacetylase (regulator of RNase III)
MKTVTVNGVSIILKTGDITDENVDAVVNAANPKLLGGAGVDGAIHAKGGQRILAECRKIGGCKPGDAVITTGGNLKAKYVIHTVGPIWHGGNNREDKVLASAYSNSLILAKSHGLGTISFPSISTGAYGFPLQRAAGIALKTIVQFARTAGSIKEIRLVLFRDDIYKIYETALAKIEM